MSKLGLDPIQVDRARATAGRIADQVQGFIDAHTTVSVERSVVRLLGVDGVDQDEAPLPNRVVEAMIEADALRHGAARVLGAAGALGVDDPQAAAQAIADGRLGISELLAVDRARALEAVTPWVDAGMARIEEQRARRLELAARLGTASGQQLYLIVATGDIHEDVGQAQAAVRQGADIVAVIRTTGQSLLDYVPYGPTREGYGGTYATQANFRIMREALDDVGEQVGRYVQLVNYASGLCMPEISVMGAFERLDMLLNDSMYGILFRDINMRRTLVDQSLSRMINAYAGAVINTGEDNYLTTSDAVQAAHTVLASQFVNEQFGLRAGLRPEQLGLGHAFEIDPAQPDGLLMEIAQAQMAREIFPDHPLKYMPPTKYMTGNIFRGQVQNALFNLVSVMTGQRIHLLGMLTEAIHTPFLSDRYLAVENARYVMNTAEHLGEEIQFAPGGRIQRRAHTVLADALAFLETIEACGLMTAIERGMFAGISRPRDGGKGAGGVIVKADGYENPFVDRFRAALPLPVEEVAHALTA
jgi:beta-lysine 5,6-aminomutase alpha subunit